MDNIEEIVKSVIEKISQKQPDQHNELEQVWSDSIDERNREKTHFVGIKNNVVYIMVDSPARLHQLKSKKNTLLRNFKKITPEISDIIYRVGQM